MNHHRDRDDFSRFLVHLSREYDGKTAKNNLISILKSKSIYSRNPHCLFHRKINQIGFSQVLRRKFNTVCFTEVPLNQIRLITGNIKGRRIQLQPYGLVFWKQGLLDDGANPAVYVNSQADGLREFLLSEFDRHFKNQTSYRSFQKRYGSDADSIIRYFSLVNIISDKVDFSWEREWRFMGNFKFQFDQLVAIVVPRPNEFRRESPKHFTKVRWKEISRIPVISPEWNYERLVEELTLRLWEKAS